MGRMTRKKAAEVAEQLHIDEDELLVQPLDESVLAAKTNTIQSSTNDRPPLGEIAPNSADSKSPSEDDGELRRSTRGKKGKKSGSKGKTLDLAAGSASRPDLANEQYTQEVTPDDNDSVPSPASEEAAEDLMKDGPELVRDHISHASIPPAPAVKLTRSQVRRQPETPTEPKSLIDGIGQNSSELEDMKEEVLQNMAPAIETHEPVEDAVKDDPPSALDAPPSPLPSAVPNVVSHLRADTPAKRSASNKENIEPDSMPSPNASAYDLLEEAVVGAVTPPSQTRPSTTRTEDHIAALDELDDAVDTVSNDIPDVQTSPEKAQKAKQTTPPKKKAAPVVRTTKASAARISMAHNKDATPRVPSLGKPRTSMALGRASSVRESSVMRSTSGGKRVTSASSAKDDITEPNGEKKEVVIPHSKARPISMSFPTPPPPPKSTKAPTQSTFQLPGEAVAAKLKAAREARQQKEAEEAKKPAFKARPVPTTMSKAPVVRQTNASKARESIMTGKDFKPTASTSTMMAHKRANSVATTRPSAPPRPRVVSKEPTIKPLSTSTSKPLTTLSSSVRPRPSTAMADLTKPRASLATCTGPTNGARIPSNPSAKGTAKGKEVFNRVANAKAAADKEKADREAAAKKARAEAAERSRQLSREFAEKQRAKKAAAAAKAEVVA